MGFEIREHIARAREAFDRSRASGFSIMAEDISDLFGPEYDWMLDESFSEIVEDDRYHPEVKQASMLAANASRKAKESGDPEHHHHAGTLHKIAAGVARAHGYRDLADKHMHFHQKHSGLAQKAGTGS